MTQEITTELKDHIVVFGDKSTRKITKRQFDYLWDASGKGVEAVRLEGMLIRFAQIAKMLTVKEYESQYPSNRTDEYRNFTKDPFKWENQPINAIEEMAKGLRKYIDSDRYKGSPQTMELLRKMEARTA